MNWLQLKTAVRDWANRTDLADSLLLTMLELAEQRIYGGRDGLRLQSMLVTATVTPGALPVRFVQAERVAWLTNGQRVVLQSMPTEAFALYEAQSGSPRFYSIRGNVLLVAPGSQAVELVYYARPAPLAADTDTQAVLDAYPSVYLYALLAQVGEWLRDAEMVAQYLPMLAAAKKDAQEADDDARRGGTPLVITSDQVVRA